MGTGPDVGQDVSGERRVSVVVPTHNRWKLLLRTLRTVLAQEDVDVEVIVVDDGSHDGTAERVQGLGDHRIRVVRHGSAQREAAARNSGLDLASAPWVAFVDDDDLWAPRRLANQLDALSGSEALWACSTAVLIDERLAVLGFHAAPAPGDVVDRLLGLNAVPGGGSGVLARTSLVREVGCFDQDLSGVADWDLWIRLAAASPVATVDLPDVGYTVHTSNMSSNVGLMVDRRSRLLAKHEHLRRRRKVDIDEAWFLSYLLGQQLVAGDRRGAARTKARLARSARSTGALAAVLPVALAPGVAARRHWQRLLDAGEPGWREHAERWLESLRLQHADHPDDGAASAS